MSDYHINVLYSAEDDGYIADIPDLDACSAFGASPEEALAEVEKAKDAWLDAARGWRDYRSVTLSMVCLFSPYRGVDDSALRVRVTNHPRASAGVKDPLAPECSAMTHEEGLIDLMKPLSMFGHPGS